MEFNIFANNTQNEHSDLVITLTAANIEELNKKYDLEIFEQDDTYISALDRDEITEFFKDNNINFDGTYYDEIYLHIQ